MATKGQDMFDDSGGRANAVHLAGWLIVEKVEVVPLGNRPSVVIWGDIHTHPPERADARPCDTSYPVMLTDKKAEIITEWSQLRPNRLPIVVIEGRLYRKVQAGILLVRADWVTVLDVKPGHIGRLKLTKPILAPGDTSKNTFRKLAADFMAQAALTPEQLNQAVAAITQDSVLFPANFPWDAPVDDFPRLLRGAVSEGIRRLAHEWIEQYAPDQSDKLKDENLW
jgi:hypothetical protein